MTIDDPNVPPGEVRIPSLSLKNLLNIVISYYSFRFGSFTIYSPVLESFYLCVSVLYAIKGSQIHKMSL